MAPKTKTFDCVTMKHDAQQAIQAEWQRRKEQFDSYEQFLRATLQQSAWGRKVLKRLTGPEAPSD